MKELKNFEKEIEFCSYCPKLCRFSCPVAKATYNEASTPTGKMTVLKLVKDGVIEFSNEVAELIYQCSGCIISRTYCEHKIEVISAFEAGRAVAVEKGIAPKRVLEFGEGFLKKGNPYKEDFSRKMREISAGKHLEKSSALVFPGCTMAHYFPETISDIIKVLDRLNFEFEILDEDELCCGYPLFALGHWKILEAHRRKLAEKISNYELIISPCPTCVWFLKTHYLNAGLIKAGDIRHTTEFLRERVSQLRLGKKISEEMVYHDPCHLGRYLGVYDAPREILKMISEKGFKEFYEKREGAECCGGGGGLPLSHPNIAREITKLKLRQFREIGGDILVSACPMCERMFKRTAQDDKIIVKDIVNLIAEIIE